MSRKDKHQLLSEALAGILEKTHLSLNSIVKKIKSVSDDINSLTDKIREIEIQIQDRKRYLDTLIDERNECEEQIEQIRIMIQNRIL
jgi:chromosome segregation ATPase